METKKKLAEIHTAKKKKEKRKQKKLTALGEQGVHHLKILMAKLDEELEKMNPLEQRLALEDSSLETITKKKLKNKVRAIQT